MGRSPSSPPGWTPHTTGQCFRTYVQFERYSLNRPFQKGAPSGEKASPGPVEPAIAALLGQLLSRATLRIHHEQRRDSKDGDPGAVGRPCDGRIVVFDV